MTGDSLLRQNDQRSNGERSGPVHKHKELLNVQSQEGSIVGSMQHQFALEMVHYVPHDGFAYSISSKGEPDVLQRMKRQVDDSGEINLEQRQRFLLWDQWMFLYIIWALIAHQQHQEYCDAIDEEQERAATENSFLLNGMNDEQKQCVNRVTHNPKADLEKQILKSGVNARL
eukprot:scaffold6403_cov128-Skeletonema_dohrnii-CCMP3373.AAC.13